MIGRNGKTKHGKGKDRFHSDPEECHFMMLPYNLYTLKEKSADVTQYNLLAKQLPT